ncbi:hypothetical protein BGZ51_000629 [Haplosporangium sp. Z 767]|nr:hypothetical protein BGZ51_000629 [Haplosporangium sp. Z 767]
MEFSKTCSFGFSFESAPFFQVFESHQSTTMPSFTHYYRVKRNKQTFFISIPNHNVETVLNLKQRLVKAIGCAAENDGPGAAVTSPADIRLLIRDKRDSTKYNKELDDSKTLSASGLEDQQIIAMTLKSASGSWEDVFIEEQESVTDLDDLEDEPEQVAMSRSSKGKGRA